MRYLVQCKQCQRQYDSGRRMVGARFYCFCGEVLVVRDFTVSAEARTVICSSCGGARRNMETQCGYCQGPRMRGHHAEKKLFGTEWNRY